MHLSHSRPPGRSPRCALLARRTTEFCVLQNCIAVHSTLRPIFSCRPKAVEATYAREREQRIIGERFLAHVFHETISARARAREVTRGFAIKRIRLPLAASRGTARLEFLRLTRDATSPRNARHDVRVTVMGYAMRASANCSSWTSVSRDHRRDATPRKSPLHHASI